ncbi:MAG: hypothetical protein M1814_005789 [Vezdaea aestivalis]|nr:MAG: hypothetical protein M1814_005789 [Vezdaea aestivalis]
MSPSFTQILPICQSSAFVPPPPSSLPKPAPPKTYRRLRKYGRLLFYLAVGTGLVWAVDKQFYYSSLTRTTRTIFVVTLASLDYKINFRANPPLARSIEALNARNAERVYDLLKTNGGLYLKMGQAIAMQSAVLPPEFQKMFAKMFDDAPQNDWVDVEKVIREDFGKSPEDVFGVSFDGEAGKGVMEKAARASASVAQVHWARLADGREVAIKVQKREIAQQVAWDLWAFKTVMHALGWWHDLPIYNFVPFISQRLQLECDFENEASNSERMAQLVRGEPRLNGRVYIPPVIRSLTSKRVMTAEWVEGVHLWDKESLTAPWKGDNRGSPGVHGGPLDPPGAKPELKADEKGRFKPNRDSWRGAKRDGGLGVSFKDVMTIMVDLFSAQMFLWGEVHADPHPGNIFIRRLPSGKPELVLIDHGLYIRLDPEFRHEYALFWKSLMTFDNKTLGNIVQGWGIKNADIFASATLMTPYTGGSMQTSKQLMEQLPGASRDEQVAALQQKARKGIREVLGDTNKLPRELIFLARNLRIVQGNNQYFGSPVNRIKITGSWAARSLVDSTDLTYQQRIANLGRHLIFKLVILGSDIVFYTAKVRQFFGRGKGMDDEMEQHLKMVAKDTFGVELSHGMFEG